MYQTHDCRGTNYYRAGGNSMVESRKDTIKDVVIAGVTLLLVFAVPFGITCLLVAN